MVEKSHFHCTAHFTLENLFDIRIIWYIPSLSQLNNHQYENCLFLTHEMTTQVESELKELDAEEAAEYLESLGATEGGLGSLVRLR